MAVGSSVGTPQLGTPLSMKLVLIGDTCGKSELFFVYKGDGFKKFRNGSVGVDFHVKEVVLHNERINVLTMVIPSCFGRSDLCSTFCSGADAVVACYDITAEHTFNSVPDWVSICSVPEDAVVALVGCRSDLESERVVPVARAEELARTLHHREVKFFETSAKTGHNVDQVFNSVISDVLHLRSNVAKQTSVDQTRSNSSETDCLLL